MVGEMVWFLNIWKRSRKSMSWEPERPVLGIMAFEISKLMSKLVNLWQSLADRQIVMLREEIANSIGLRKLVSENEDDLIDLAFAEIIENLKSVTNSVVMLGKKCMDPTYHNLDRIFNAKDGIDPKWCGRQYRIKEMEKKVKKMERFVAATEQLYQELEVLAELEQSLRRMRAGPDVKLLEFQQKVMWQRQEVKNLREMSPWVRTYDFTVRLLLRVIFTIIERIKCVCDTKPIGESNVYEQRNSDCLIRSNSLRQTSVYPSETNTFRYGVPLGRSFSSLGLGSQKTKSKNVKSHPRCQSSILSGKQNPVKARRFTPVSFTGCMAGKSDSPVVERDNTPSPCGSLAGKSDSPVVERENTPSSCGSLFRSNDVPRKNAVKLRDILCNHKNPMNVSFINAQSCPLDPPPSTLGYAALALRYANIVILIEKLASSPHLISLDAKDDLYDMLPTAIRSLLRAKLKTFSRSLGSSVYNASAFAAEWRLAVGRILEWLCPLARDTLRWQSERNFERQRSNDGPNARLVQTLYFASQVETEAAIVELLVGLNYLYRFDCKMFSAG